ncbi:MAG TPA: hypothetical protein VGL60_01215 [Acidimicrobiales bacterium]
MNYFGHLLVAGAARPLSAAQALGTVLPDLAPMGGLDAAALPDEVLTGRALHHLADRAFHAHPSFVALSGSLRARLVDAGVGQGGARGCAHMGTELLLDGTLGGRDLPAVLRASLAQAHLIEPALSRTAAVRWAATVAWARRSRPEDLADPRAVGARVLTVLSRRHRLAIDPSLEAIVAGALGDHQAAVVECAAELFADVARSLAPA